MDGLHYPKLFYPRSTLPVPLRDHRIPLSIAICIVICSFWGGGYTVTQLLLLFSRRSGLKPLVCFPVRRTVEWTCWRWRELGIASKQMWIFSAFLDIIERFERISADVRVAKGVTQEAIWRADKDHRCVYSRIKLLC